jgi:hypothetical protein
MAPSLPPSLRRGLSCSQGLPQTCPVVSAARNVFPRPAPRSHLLQHLIILIVKSRSILNTPPQLQMLSGAPENALAESDSTFQSSRWAWKHLEVLRSAGEGYRSVWEVCMWHPDRFTFCRCIGVFGEYLSLLQQLLQ